MLFETLKDQTVKIDSLENVVRNHEETLIQLRDTQRAYFEYLHNEIEVLKTRVETLEKKVNP